MKTSPDPFSTAVREPRLQELHAPQTFETPQCEPPIGFDLEEPAELKAQVLYNTVQLLASVQVSIWKRHRLGRRRSRRTGYVDDFGRER